MRVVVAEDSVLFREGLVRVLDDAGFELSAQVGDAAALHRAVIAAQAGRRDRGRADAADSDR